MGRKTLEMEMRVRREKEREGERELLVFLSPCIGLLGQRALYVCHQRGRGREGEVWSDLVWFGLLWQWCAAEGREEREREGIEISGVHL